MKKIRLGDMLVSEGLISSEQLEKALSHQKDIGGKLGRLLIDLGFVDEDTLLEKLSSQLETPIVDLRKTQVNHDVAKILPENIARRYRALVLDEKDGEYIVAISDPLDLYAIDHINSVIQGPTKIVIVREEELLTGIGLVYRHTEQISGFAEELAEDLQVASDIAHKEEESKDFAQETPIKKLLDSIFEDAVQMGASDIHIEPGDGLLRIRQRIDGVLHEHIMHEKFIASALAQRLKLMSNLNIAEKRIPQDGRFELNIKNKKIDVRLSTMPTQFGESIVMRLLDHDSIDELQLTKIGLSEAGLKKMRYVTSLPYGMMLVTGPTGSGKTTSLYAALNEINKEGVKIITVEDPVEYQLERINQTQVNPKIGLDFANILRTTLRQDPDIIMIGEIRDTETAHIAIRAALTGHLVLATLHTNDAPSSISRLMDMGVPGYLIAASLRFVMAQRLVRRICKSCKHEVKATPEQMTVLRARFHFTDEEFAFSEGKGCSYCHHTGYRGRIGVFETLTMTKQFIDLLTENKMKTLNEEMAQSLQGGKLADEAFNLAKQGITSIEEVFHLSGDVEIPEGMNG